MPSFRVESCVCILIQIHCLFLYKLVKSLLCHYASFHLTFCSDVTKKQRLFCVVSRRKRIYALAMTGPMILELKYFNSCQASCSACSLWSGERVMFLVIDSWMSDRWWWRHFLLIDHVIVYVIKFVCPSSLFMVFPLFLIHVASLSNRRYKCAQSSVGFMSGFVSRQNWKCWWNS